MRSIIGCSTEPSAPIGHVRTVYQMQGRGLSRRSVDARHRPRRVDVLQPKGWVGIRLPPCSRADQCVAAHESGHVDSGQPGRRCEATPRRGLTPIEFEAIVISRAHPSGRVTETVTCSCSRPQPRPHRPYRPSRIDHPAPQRTPPPHRNRPHPPPNPRLNPRPRPQHHHHQRRHRSSTPRTHTRPHQGLPTHRRTQRPHTEKALNPTQVQSYSDVLQHHTVATAVQGIFGGKTSRLHPSEPHRSQAAAPDDPRLLEGDDGRGGLEVGVVVDHR